MIALWMLFATVVGALLTVGALAAERGARAIGAPTRFVWLAAGSATALWPLLALVFASLHGARDSASVAALAPVGAGARQVIRIFANTSAFTNIGHTLDIALVSAWVCASVLLTLRFILTLRRLARQSTAWRTQHVDGVLVNVSPDVGPAVVGLSPAEVVVPEWVLELDAPLRALVLRHECEHGAAGDPRLLFASAVLVALMPWNVALWVQARRLRLSIEMDCDARVLRAHPDVDRYGALLVSIAERRACTMPLSVAGISEPTSNLERRIIAMRAATPRFPSLQALAFGVVALGAVVGACDVQAPDRATPPTMPANTPIAVAGATAKGSNIQMAFFPDSVAATNKPRANYQTRDPITFKARPADSATVAREKGATRTRDKHDTIRLTYYRKDALSLSGAFPKIFLQYAIPSIVNGGYAYPKPTNGDSAFQAVKSTKH